MQNIRKLRSIAQKIESNIVYRVRYNRILSQLQSTRREIIKLFFKPIDEPPYSSLIHIDAYETLLLDTGDSVIKARHTRGGGGVQFSENGVKMRCQAFSHPAADSGKRERLRQIFVFENHSLSLYLAPLGAWIRVDNGHVCFHL